VRLATGERLAVKPANLSAAPEAERETAPPAAEAPSAEEPSGGVVVREDEEDEDEISMM